MFDGELPAAECELLARRLTRDDALRAQWSRYAMIGAALRAERGVALHDRVAWRVQAADRPGSQLRRFDRRRRPMDARVAAVARAAKLARPVARWMRFARPVLGAGIAAGVAAMSIVWLQGSSAGALLASNPVPTPSCWRRKPSEPPWRVERAPVEAARP